MSAPDSMVVRLFFSQEQPVEDADGVGDVHRAVVVAVAAAEARFRVELRQVDFPPRRTENDETPVGRLDHRAETGLRIAQGHLPEELAVGVRLEKV